MNTAQELQEIEAAILSALSAQGRGDAVSEVLAASASSSVADTAPGLAPENAPEVSVLATTKSTTETSPASAAQGAPFKRLNPELPEPIAIVGLSGFFPKSHSVHEFWHFLDQDAFLIEEIPSNRFDSAAFYDLENEGKSRSKWGGFIPDIASFDPAFFNILPGEAVKMDPRQRLLLMSAYQTITDAGYSPEMFKQSKTGVFIALQDNEYLQVLKEAGLDTSELYAQNCLLANQISYFFDFRGASEIVDAQCPGAGVAIHRAVNALRSGEITQALVGAANLL